MVAFVTNLLLYVAFVCTPCCWLLRTVISSRMEQRIILKFLVKLRKTPTECFKLLKEVYGKDVMSKTQIFKWHKRFEKGREEVEDDPKTGRTSTMRTDENITSVKQLVRTDCRLPVRMISDELSLNKESVRTMLEGRPVILHFLAAFLKTFVPFEDLRPRHHIFTINLFQKFKTLSWGLPQFYQKLQDDLLFHSGATNSS